VADEKGANELMKDLRSSGLIALDPTQYNSDEFSKKTLLYSEGNALNICNFIKSVKLKPIK
jgi:hypothetical protein